jgi:O-antigen/teichoic acid export membrane protein
MNVPKLEKYQFIALVGWFSKLVVIFVSIIQIRLLVELVGMDGFGAFAYLINLVPWLALLNFGLPFLLQNMVSKHRSEEKNYRYIVEFINKVSLFLLVICAIFAVLVTYLLSFVSVLQNVSLLPLWGIVFLIALNSIIELYTRFLFSEHRGHLGNLLPAIGAVLTLVFLLVCFIADVHDLDVVLVCCVLPYLCVAAIAVWFGNTKKEKQADFTKGESKPLLTRANGRLALGFFVFQALAAAVLRIDYFVIADLFGDDQLAIYALIQRFYLTVLFFFTALLTALWPHFSEELNKKNHARVFQLIVRNLFAGFVIALCASAIFSYWHPEILKILSKEQINLDGGLLLWLTVYLLIRIWTDVFATLLLSVNRTIPLNVSVFFQACVTFAAEYYFGREFGLKGIFIGLVVGYLCTAFWILPVSYFRMVRYKGPAKPIET